MPRLRKWPVKRPGKSNAAEYMVARLITTTSPIETSSEVSNTVTYRRTTSQGVRRCIEAAKVLINCVPPGRG